MTNLKQYFRKGVVGLAVVNIAFYFAFVALLAAPVSAASANIIIDNDYVGVDGEYTDSGDWSTFPDPSGNGGDYNYETAATNARWAQWTPVITSPGEYQVSVHYSVHSARPKDAKYTVTDASGINPVQVVNQTITSTGATGDFIASGWKGIGTYQFNIGSTGNVKLIESAIGDTCADAVRFVHTNVAPTTPKLLSPTNQTATQDLAPTFKWQASTDDDDDDDDITYQLRIDGVKQLLLDPKKIEYTPSSDLSEGVHNWEVKASDGSVDTPWSDPRQLIIDSINPTADANGVYGRLEGDPVRLTSKNTVDNGSGIASYKWLVKNADGKVVRRSNQANPIISAFNLPGTYNVKLTVTDKAGNPDTDTTDIIIANVRPDAPNVTLVRDNGIVKIKWNKVADTRGYKIIRNGEYISDLLDNSITSYIDYNTENGQTYKYRVVAYDKDQGYRDQFSRSDFQEVYIPQPKVVFVSVAQAAEAQASKVVPGTEENISADDQVDGKVEAEQAEDEDAKPEETSEKARTNWPMIVAIIIASVIVLGGAAYWWYGVSEDEDQI